MTSTEENKALLMRFLDAFGAGDIATAAECFDADRYYSHTYEADLAGTWAQQRANYRAAIWTDVDVERIAVWAERDRVGHHSSFTATHSGPFLGIPASGQTRNDADPRNVASRGRKDRRALGRLHR